MQGKKLLLPQILQKTNLSGFGTALPTLQASDFAFSPQKIGQSKTQFLTFCFAISTHASAEIVHCSES